MLDFTETRTARRARPWWQGSLEAAQTEGPADPGFWTGFGQGAGRSLFSPLQFLFGGGSRSSSISASGRRFPSDILARMIPYSFPLFNTFFQPAPMWQSAFGGNQGGWGTPSPGAFPSDGGWTPGPMDWRQPGVSIMGGGGTGTMQEPLFGLPELLDYYNTMDPEKSGDLPRVFREAGLDPSKKYTTSELSDAFGSATGLSGRSKGDLFGALAHLSDLAYLGGLPGGGLGGMGGSQPNWQGTQPSVPPEVQQSLQSGNATGLSWNPVTKSWVQAQGAPELLWWGPTNETFYHGQKLTSPQTEQLLQQGSPYNQWSPALLPPVVQDQYKNGTAQGLSWDPVTQAWVQTTGVPDLLWWGPTNETFYQGQKLTSPQVESLLQQGPGASTQYPFNSAPRTAEEAAMQEFLNRSLQRPAFSFLNPSNIPTYTPTMPGVAQAAAPPPIVPPWVTAPQISFLDRSQYLSPMQTPGLQPDYVQPIPGAMDVNTIMPSFYNPSYIQQLGVTPASLYVPQLPIAQGQLPLGMSPAQFIQADREAKLGPVLDEQFRQYKIEVDAARARMAASGLAGSGVEEGTLGRMREDIMTRVSNETRTANDSALANFYEIANKLELTNTQLAQQAMQRQAELAFDVENANQKADLDIYHREYWRRQQNALYEQQANEFEAQKFFEAQVQNATQARKAYEDELNRRIFNSGLSKDMQIQVGNWDTTRQQLTNQFGLQWGLADMETQRTNAKLDFEARVTTAGFTQASNEIVYKGLLSLAVSNAAQLNDMIKTTGNQQLESYRAYLNAYSNTTGLSVNAILGVINNEANQMRTLLGDNWQQNDFAMKAFQLNVHQYEFLLNYLAQQSPTRITRQRQQTKGGLI